MLVLTNTAAQTIEVGQTVTFNNVIFNSKCNKNEFFRLGTGSIQVVPGTYEVSFGANVSGATADTPVQLNIEYNGSPLPETTMISTPSAADALNSVYRGTILQVPCVIGSGTFTVTNTGTTAITIGADPAFTIVRRG